MGNVEVAYKERRGAHAPGEPITDPKDWVEQLLKHDFAETKTMYDGAPIEVKAEINEVFGENIFGKWQDAKMWF